MNLVRAAYSLLAYIVLCSCVSEADISLVGISRISNIPVGYVEARSRYKSSKMEFIAISFNAATDLFETAKENEFPALSYKIVPCGSGDDEWGLAVGRVFERHEIRQGKTNKEAQSMYIAFVPANFVETAKADYDDHDLDFSDARKRAEDNGICLQVAAGGFAGISSLRSNQIPLKIDLF